MLDTSLALVQEFMKTNNLPSSLATLGTEAILKSASSLSMDQLYEDTQIMTISKDDASYGSDMIAIDSEKDLATKDQNEPIFLYMKMDMSNINAAAYMGVLIFVNVFYLSLMVVLTVLIVHVRNHTRQARDSSIAR